MISSRRLEHLTTRALHEHWTGRKLKRLIDAYEELDLAVPVDLEIHYNSVSPRIGALNEE